MNTPVVTAGTVTRSGGDTPAADATVELLAYPDSEEMAALEEGDTFDLSPVGRTTTDANGAYEMRVDPGVDLSQFARDGRTMDVSLRVTTAEGTAVEEASLSPDEATGGAEAEAALAGEDRQSSLPTNADLELTPMSERESFQTEEHEAATTQAAASGDYTVQYTDLGTRWTNVGAVFVKVTGVWAQVKHRVNADASLGAAVDSGSGYYASYTVDRYSSSEIQFPKHGRYSYKFFDTQRPYGKYYNYNNCGVLINTTVKPINGSGNSGSRERDASHLIPANQPRDRCAPGVKGARHTQDIGKATTWATGAKVEDIVGFNMSTRTGFSQQASYEFEFMSAGRAVCGTRSDPSYPGDPGVIVVQDY